MSLEANIDQTVRLIARSEGTCVAFTGAGMSAESGIPTFRGEGGLWDEYPPSAFGTPVGLASSFLFRFQKLRRFLIDALRTFLDAKPNPGHYALAEMEQNGYVRGVITQNVDNLHQEAGSREVTELHGSFFSGRCYRCGRVGPVERPVLEGLARGLESETTGRWSLIRTYRRRGPRCPSCERIVRPNVVLFGEGLNSKDYDRAVEMAERCGVLLVVGSTVLVRPASDIPYIALHAGAKIVEINTERTALTPLADIFLKGPSGSILQKLVAAVK